MTFWIDAGGAAVQQPASRSRAAGTLGGGMWLSGRRISLGADAGGTTADDSVAATQGVLRAQFAATRWSLSTAEVSATSIGLTLPGSNGNRSALLRQSISRDAVSVFAGAGISRTSRYALESHGAVQQVGATAAHRGAVAAFTWQRSTSNDWQLMEAAGIVLRRAARSYELHDATVDVSWRSERATLSASQSWRAGAGATSGRGHGFALLAAWQLSANTQLIAQSGRQLADALRGVPQARYTGLAVRWTLGTGRALRARALGDVASPADIVRRTVTGAELQLTPREGGADATVSIVAPEGAVVEIATSANDWAPQLLTRSGTAFVVRLSLTSGSHRVAVRVNGGAWRAPRGLSVVSDDFGGSAGLVVVP